MQSISLAKSVSVLVLLLVVMQFGVAFANDMPIDSLEGSSNSDTAELSEQRLTQQRQRYARAMRMVREGQWQRLRQYRGELTSYPLYPYLIYADLIADLHYKRRSAVNAYLTEYADTVKATHLRNRWLEYLAKRGYWKAYTEAYRPSTANHSQQCNFYLANYRLDNHSKAINGGLAVWANGRSMPKACDRLFGILIKQGHISEALAWQRFNAAMDQHNYQLARYLKRFFRSPSYKQRYQLYYAAHSNPWSINQSHQFTGNSPEEVKILEHGLVRLAPRNAQTALKLWTRYRLSHEFSHSAQSKIISAIIKNLYTQGHRQVADSYHLDNLQLLNQTLEGSLAEWRIRQSLAELDWPMVSAWLVRLPQHLQQKSLWRYWAIRSAESEADSSEETRLFQLTSDLAKERDFYGFLASDKIGADYSLNHQSLIVDQQQLRALASNPAMRRARELHFHDYDLDANREWASAARDFQYQDWLAAAILANQWQWHNKAIASLGTAKYWDDIDIRFPLAYQQYIQTAATNTGVADYMLFALARQESAFNPIANSSAGAMGLVQVMPATAKATAKKYRIPYRNKKQLHQIATNLAIGSRYYQSLLERFDNNRILATAAYNAGPSRVDQWLSKTSGKLPFDVWMTLIPFKETRHYVSNVLMYSVLYSRKLGLEVPLLTPHEKKTLL